MRVLIVLSSSAFFRHFDSVVTELCAAGHSVKVVTRMASKGDEDAGYKAEMTGSVARYDHGAYEFSLRKRRDRLAPGLRTLRATLNYAMYCRTQHSSPQLAERVALGCPRALRSALRSAVGRRLVSSDRLLAAYRRLQRALPADPQILQQVTQERPDVVVGCPFIYTRSADLEYLRAAQSLGVPTVASVASWDNLSTKGAFHLLPDRVLVWNDRLADEAASIHAIPRDRIASTGAAKFDAYFDLEPSLSRAEFCASVGLDPERPYLLYLGSSQQVAGDETAFVQGLTTALERRSSTSDLQMVVRPHPLNDAPWRVVVDERITVFPPRGQRPDLPRHRSDYFNSRSYATAACGVNTTALIEAAVVDRPCLSIVGEQHRAGQLERGHFRHLLDGGCLHGVRSFEEAGEAASEILAGRDRTRGARRAFVEAFVRPKGLDRPAGEMMADAILGAGRNGRSL